MRPANWFLAMAVCLLAAALPCAAGTLPAIDKLLPAETVFVVATNSFAELNQKFEKTDIYRLYKDPAMAPFIENSRERLLKSLEKNRAFQRFAAADYPLPQGKVAFALVLPQPSADGSQKDTVMLVICQWGSELPKFRDLFEKQIKDMEDKGGSRRQEEYRGTQVVSVFEAAGNDAEQPEPVFSYAFIDDVFVVSDRKEDVMFVVARAAGASGRTLGEDADYQAAITRIRGGDVTLYLNVKRLVETLMQQQIDSRTMVRAMGIDRVAGIALGLELAPDSAASLTVRGYIRTAGEKQGILRMLDMAPVAIRVPDFVAGDSCSFAIININAASVYDEIFRIANSIDPRAAAAISSPMTAPSPDGRPGVELKRDILAYLRPGLWSADTPRKVAGSDQPEILSIGAIAVSDRSKLESSLARLHEQYFGNDKELRRDFFGHVIYSLSFGAEWEGDETPGANAHTGEQVEQQQAPAFTVTDSYLLFGDVRLIEDAI
ncbi:MAG TPA: hypothetical protein VLH60_08275, partial [Sedimentisphaerales bacterium]|nr:hypothetical protein [Sedimentisphaerales bacterium]